MESRRVIVIGGGPGGYVAALRSAQLGAKVTLIEKDRIGGTCLNRGCIPTKALLSDVKLLRSLRTSTVFQPLFSGVFDPLPAMMDRKEGVVRELVKGTELLLDSQRVTVKHGRAELSGPNRVILSGAEQSETLEADVIILATGSKSKVLPHIRPDGQKIITSDEALEMRRAPEEMVIIGGGYIGVEFATIFNGLGSRVTIVEVLDDILLNVEGEMVRQLKRVLQRDGIRILTKSSVDELTPVKERLKLRVRTPQGGEEILADNVLVAVGRGPDLDLDFSKTGIRVSQKGVEVNGRMETTAPQVYAVGDVTGGVLLAHVASEQGATAAENAAGLERQWEPRLIPTCIFTHPEIASVGLTETEARGRGEIRIGRFPFRSSSKAVILGETDGLIKVITSQQTNEVLGVHIIGPEASTLVSVASLMIHQGCKAEEFSRIIQAHPTLPEGLKEAALDASGLAIHLPKPLIAKKR
jgi:dihydrolipoamide dehydrogenase